MALESSKLQRSLRTRRQRSAVSEKSATSPGLDSETEGYDSMLQLSLNATSSTSTKSTVAKICTQLEMKNGGVSRSEILDCSQKPDTPVLNGLKKGFSGGSLDKVKATLLNKHQRAKDSIDSLCVGGGVSMWPEMNSMRLTVNDIAVIITLGIALCMSTLALFNHIHGQLLLDLRTFTANLRDVVNSHPILTDRDNTSFVNSVLDWHAHQWKIVDDVHLTFEISLYDAPLSYKLCVVTYVVAVTVLLYYLADNVLVKSHLTPRRIRNWILLLVVTATWTGLIAQLLVAAQQLEAAVRNNVHYLNEQLNVLIQRQLDSDVYHDVLMYWRTRSLLASSPPLLSVMGLVAVADINYYLQYYSLPILSALCLPIVRLAWALVEIYRPAAMQPKSC